MVAPSDGKRVRHPERYCREVGVDVTAGGVAPGTGNLECDAAGFPRQCFDGDLGAALEGDVAVDNPDEAGETFHCP